MNTFKCSFCCWINYYLVGKSHSQNLLEQAAFWQEDEVKDVYSLSELPLLNFSRFLTSRRTPLSERLEQASRVPKSYVACVRLISLHSPDWSGVIFKTGLVGLASSKWWKAPLTL